ncbi:transporter [Leuconostoc citreum]|uniref:lipopolysaccharide biosynthesis protein n=1 Tax=Leuconostoc citreum TaxID=33964 RepID=UPI0021822B09|nr:transporter [Leuconostoc citreum]MCS8594987.1 transporter [Leuconostoc citreum]
MNNSSTLKNIFKNGSIAGTTFLLSTIMSFAVRTFFVKNLGEAYLGLNGVFSSVIQMLSLTDLGMEAAFSFVLYQPIAQNDKSSVVKIIRTFKKVYETVGLIVLGVGLALIPFLSVIIGKQGNNLNNVLLIYGLFLANSVGSYFFTYNRTLLNSDQRNYVITLISFFVNLLGNILQIITLIYFKSPVIFALIMFCTTMTSNFLINLSVKKYYPFVFKKYSKKNLKLDKVTKIILIKNSIGGLSNKIGSMVVFASDNILISIFVNLSTVGLYANYTMITNNLSGLINRMIQPMTASIGNMKETSDEQILQFFKKFNLIVYSVPLFMAPQLFILLRPFIQWWIGGTYVLSQEITLLIVINLTLQIFRLPSLTFIDAYGLQWVQKWKSIFESIVNVLFSLILLIVFNMGLEGILLGTIISTLVTVSWYEPYIVLKHAIKDDTTGFIFNYLRGLIGVIITLLVAWFITHQLVGEGIIFLFELLFIVLIISLVMVFVVNVDNKTFKAVVVNLMRGKLK